MATLTKFKTIWIIWIAFDQLWSLVRAQGGPGEDPDWDHWLVTHFEGLLFTNQYKLVWDHGAWCESVFNCRGPQGEIVRHQMCVHAWLLNVGTDCRNYNDLRVHDTEYERTRLLDTHNNYREEVSLHGINRRFYGAANIRRMTWDYSLEDMAINWGLQCYTHEHKDRTCRRIHGFDYVAMTLERKEFSTNATWSSEYIVEKWAESLSSYHYENPKVQELHSNFTHGTWDRATQMLWHSTYKVGCGVVSYTSRGPSDDKDFKLTWYKHVICYYAPPGNKIGKPIFQEGAPGKCPPGTSTRFSCYGADYPSLCHFPDDPMNQKIRRRWWSRQHPPIPLYSQYVDATITAATSPRETPRILSGSMEGKELNVREGGGPMLLPSIASILPSYMLLIRASC